MKNRVVVETSYLRKGKYVNSGKSRFLSFLFGLIVIAATLLSAYNLKTKFESQVTSYQYFDLLGTAIQVFVSHAEASEGELVSFMYLNTLGLLGFTLFVKLFVGLFTTFSKRSKFYFNHYKLFRFFRIIDIINLIFIIFLQFFTKLIDLEVLPLGSIDGAGYPEFGNVTNVLIQNVARLFMEDKNHFLMFNLAFILLNIPMIISLVATIVRTIIKYRFAYATFAPLLVVNLFVYVHLIARKSYVYKFENYNEDYYKIKKIQNKSIFNIITKLVIYGLIIPAVLVGAVWLNHQRSVPALDKVLFRFNGYDIYKSHLLGVLYGYLISGTITVFLYYRHYYGEMYLRTLEGETEDKEEVKEAIRAKKAKKTKKTSEVIEEKKEEPVVEKTEEKPTYYRNYAKLAESKETTTPKKTTKTVEAKPLKIKKTKTAEIPAKEVETTESKEENTKVDKKAEKEAKKAEKEAAKAAKKAEKK